jgi:hypothetical protein
MEIWIFSIRVGPEVSVRGMDTKHLALDYLITLNSASILPQWGGPENFNICGRKTSGKDAGWWFGGFCR